jgi:uncharacterized protein YndB with AHSA1/START domain
MQSNASHVREILHEIPIHAAPEILFALLTRAELMKTWLAPDVTADSRPGGILRLADFNGLWIEGSYLGIIPNRTVAFTWGGIDGLRIGQTRVTIILLPENNRTTLRLQHAGLPVPVYENHDLGWKVSALPRLEAIAEGRARPGTYLGDFALTREQGATAWHRATIP